MESSLPQAAQREEYERVIASGLLSRSPNLASFLRFVCERYFEGRLDEIKEYNVAVEALGRPPDFDQKRDSIVRVEAHRLRRRLAEYYSTIGATNPLRLGLRTGTYIPVFSPNPGTADGLNGTPGPGEGSRTRVVPWVWIAAGLALAAVVALAALALSSAPVRQAWKANVPTAGVDTVRILAGSTVPRHVDRDGNVWNADRFYEGGSAVDGAKPPITLTRDPELYARKREGRFSYAIPLLPGHYQLTLHFAEPSGTEGSRLFRVRANGVDLLNPIDVIADTGRTAVAHERVFRDLAPADDGHLHLQFLPVGRGDAFVNAIEILPSEPGRMRPVRMIAGDRTVRDRTGRIWWPDRYSEGGRIVERLDALRELRDAELYRSERFGNFSYSIPVAPGGRYSLTLHFNEFWFGAGRPGGGGPGTRTFDVICNGRALLRKFDVLAEAGGPMKPLVMTFNGIEPSAQGNLALSFVPVRNYAMVNAIEVVEEDGSVRD